MAKTLKDKAKINKKTGVKSPAKTPAKSSAKASAKKTPAAKKPAEKIAAKPAAKTAPPAKEKPSRKTRSARVQRRPHVTRPTPEEELAILERREYVLSLRKAKVSFRQIAAACEAKGYKGSSPASVFADYQYMLNLQYEDEALTAQHYVQEEINVLDDVHQTFYTDMKRRLRNDDGYIEYEDSKGRPRRRRATTVDPDDLRIKAASIVITCVRERAKLRNLYKAPTVKINVDDELAKLLGISTEELPDVDAPAS